MATVLIPAPLRKLTKDADTVTIICNDTTVKNIIDQLDFAYPGIRERILSENGDLNRFINIYINQEDIRFGLGLDTVVSASDVVSLMPAIAGG